LKSRKQVEEIAQAHDKMLGAGDFKSDRLVLIRHGDGTHLFFRCAFLMRLEEWVVVFSEHNGFHCYAIADLDEFAQFDEVPVIGTLGTPTP
jgi:hypothetical protein